MRPPQGCDSPRPRCRHTRAWAKIICPHRSMQPQPVSEVGPVPPVMADREKCSWPDGPTGHEPTGRRQRVSPTPQAPTPSSISSTWGNTHLLGLSNAKGHIYWRVKCPDNLLKMGKTHEQVSHGAKGRSDKHMKTLTPISYPENAKLNKTSHFPITRKAEIQRFDDNQCCREHRKGHKRGNSALPAQVPGPFPHSHSLGPRKMDNMHHGTARHVTGTWETLPVHSRGPVECHCTAVTTERATCVAGKRLAGGCTPG